MIFNEILDEEHVMTWMGLILADTGMMDDATLVQAFKQLTHRSLPASSPRQASVSL